MLFNPIPVICDIYEYSPWLFFGLLFLLIFSLILRVARKEAQASGTLFTISPIILALLSVITLLLIFFVVIPAVIQQAVHNSMDMTFNIVSKIKLLCAANAVQAIERWSEAGYSVSCRHNDIKQGPWEAWENSRLRIKGNYNNDHENGTWLIYSDDGRLYRTIEYDMGKEISNVINDDKDNA